MKLCVQNKITTWWFQPIWKICASQTGNLPQNRGKNIWNHHLDNQWCGQTWIPCGSYLGLAKSFPKPHLAMFMSMNSKYLLHGSLVNPSNSPYICIACSPPKNGWFNGPFTTYHVSSNQKSFLTSSMLVQHQISLIRFHWHTNAFPAGYVHFFDVERNRDFTHLKIQVKIM